MAIDGGADRLVLRPRVFILGAGDAAPETNMQPTRRQAGWTLLAVAGLAGGLRPKPAWGAAADDDSDDDSVVPNVFISPHGEPFRAHVKAPYPIYDWFRKADKN